MNGGDWNRGLHCRDVERDKRALPKLIPYTALGDQRQAEAGLRQALLCGEAVDQGDVGAVEPGPDQLARQGMAGILLTDRRWKTDPSLAGFCSRAVRSAIKPPGKYPATTSHRWRRTSEAGSSLRFVV